MSAVPRPRSLSTPISTLQLRRLIELALPSDAVLDAFCVDCLPEVYRQFSSGMQRTRKLNLLLTSTRPAVLLEYLRGYAPTVIEPELEQPAPLLPSAVVPHRATTRHVMSCGAVLGALLAAALVVSRCASRNHEASPGAAATASDLYAPSPFAAPAVVPSPWLTSDPASALVYAMPSGRPLGQTPWSPAPTAASESVSNSGLQVCLRSAGFIPVLVRLELGADRSRPLHIRLQPESRAVQQRGLGQETCDVPTPIID